MADSNQIFRQAALDRLSSPEQLDQLMQVTTPKSWLALTACCVLVLIAVAWSIWGSIRINVYGRGILIKHSGVFVATSTGDGRVFEILVHEGEQVAKGHLLARLEVPELSLKIRQAESTQEKLTHELQKLQAFQKEEAEAEKKDRDEQMRIYSLMLTNCQEQLEAAKWRLSAMTGTGMVGVVTLPLLLDLTNSFFVAEQDIAKTRIQIEQLDLNLLQAKERRNQQIREKEFQKHQGALALEFLTNIYQRDSEIRSPISGTVLEITVKPSQLVNANTPILSLQSEQEKLEAWLFLSSAEGKRVATNMEAQLAPVSVKKEAFGMIVGNVTSVSAMPATPQLLLRILQNPTLVAEFSQQGAPIYAVVDLKIATNTSGFQWTSRKGPEMRMTSGTLCEGTITLTTRSPMSLVLPLVKNSIGL